MIFSIEEDSSNDYFEQIELFCGNNDGSPFLADFQEIAGSTCLAILCLK